MRTNRAVKQPQIVTHEGGTAVRITAEQQLRRSVLSCMLYEDGFYEDGVAIADRIKTEAALVAPSVLAALAIEARSKFNLRHVPLYLIALLAQYARGTSLVSDTIPRVIQRADELSELLAIYARVNGVPPNAPNNKNAKGFKSKLSHQVRKGLAAAFGNFDEYHLARYNRAGAIRLRDVLFLSRPKPRDDEQKALWQRLIDNKLAVPATWEVIVSGAGAAGLTKKEAWEKVIDTWITPGRTTNHFAIIRNLRNLLEAGVSQEHLALVDAALRDPSWTHGARRILPFRYVAAARAAPMFEPALDIALGGCIAALPLLPGRTAVLVDVSGSMGEKLSARSDMTRMDAAATLASVINAESLRVFSFSDMLIEVPPRRGMAGVDAIRNSQPHNGTRMVEAVSAIHANVPHDRLIVITDEQMHPGRLPNPVCKHGYMINVASAKFGVGYGSWNHLDGMSEQVLRWIVEFEGGDTSHLSTEELEVD